MGRRALLHIGLCGALLAAVIGGGCSASRSESDLDYTGSYLRNRADGTDFSVAPQPLATYIERAINDDASVVVGVVTGGGAGPSFTADGRPATAQDAAWKTVHLRVKVIEVLDRDQVPSTINVGVVVDPKMNAKRVVSGLSALNRAIFFLDKSAVFHYDPSLFGISREGSLVASINSQGDLRMPFMTTATSNAVIPRPLTLDGLRRAVAN